MQTKEIKQALEEFFGKMGMPLSGVTVEIGQDAIALDVTSPNPEMLIGQNGQTLLELQRILKVLINKKPRYITYRTGMMSILKRDFPFGSNCCRSKISSINIEQVRFWPFSFSSYSTYR